MAFHVLTETPCGVIAGHSGLKNGVAPARLCEERRHSRLPVEPAIHHFLKRWMLGSSPGMTTDATDILRICWIPDRRLCGVRNDHSAFSAAL